MNNVFGSTLVLGSTLARTPCSIALTGGLVAVAAAFVQLDVAAQNGAWQSESPEMAEPTRTLLEIIHEGKNRNQVMNHLTYLTQEIGPRLTGSTRARLANEWARDQFESWGLENVQLQEWGTIPVGFDRGPCSGRIVEPIERDIEFSARAWSAGTDGPVRGKVMREPETAEALGAMRDELDGAWILRQAPERGSRRGVRDGGGPGAGGGDDESPDLTDLLREAGVAGFITTSRDDRVRTSSARGWRELSFEALPTDVTVAVRRADYDAINSRIADGEEVIVEFDLKHEFVEGPIPCYNTIAEIPGSEFPEQVVIISAHLDSWDGPGSEGTVDNGTGSSVTLETARILAAVDAQPRRTIRFILWTGEEQGLLGSRAYVESLSEEEKANVSAVFVDDGGTNYQGGLSCTAEMAPMLAAATAPVNYAFPQMPVSIEIIDELPRRGASDHASFTREGIPGFFWDEVGRADYFYAWHTQNDKLDQAIPEYLVQSSTCSAITAFNLANADMLLPRPVIEPEEPAIAEDSAPAAEDATKSEETKPSESTTTTTAGQ